MSTVDELVQSPANIKAVGEAIVRVVKAKYGLVVLPQREAAVRSVVLREWLRWNDERGGMPAADAPTTRRDIIAMINRQAVKSAAAKVAENYRARQQFYFDQQQPLRVMEHAAYESIAGTHLGENRDIGTYAADEQGADSQLPIRRPARLDDDGAAGEEFADFDD